jgi:D-3-phosphoglycerate dehydrogenase / 2-oxoglutarate reductase
LEAAATHSGNFERSNAVIKPLVVMVHPSSKMFPYEAWPPAFDGLDVEIVSIECKTREDVLQAVRGADVVMIGGFRVDAATIAAMDRARAICGFGHGFEGVDLDAATRAGILVMNAAHICHLEVANHAAALILALNRKIVQYDRAMRQGVWDRPAARPISTLDGETAGLVGLGAIGQALARRLQPFGLRIVAHDPYVEEHVPRELGVEMVGDLDTLLRASDWVSVQVPLNAETRHLIGERAIRAMKPTAYFVNCCRGGVVDEAALTRALQEGRIAGAGLDVFEQEPTDPANPLLRLPNVIATPHAGGESTESAALSARVASRQAAAVLRGEWPDRVVNPAVYGRLRETGKLSR